MKTFYVYDATYALLGTVEAIDLQAAIQLAGISYPGHYWVDEKRTKGKPRGAP